MSGAVVAVDVSPLETDRRAGVARLVLGWVRSLAASDPHDLRFVLASRTEVDWPFALPDRVEALVVPGDRLAIWRERALPPALEDRGVQLLHSPVTAIPLRGAFRRIATVHELSWHRRDGGEGWLRMMRQRMRLRLAVRRADRVVVPSQTTCRDLLEVQPSLAPRIDVVAPGIESWFVAAKPGGRGNAAADRQVLAGHGIREDGYLLAVGTLRRKKNLAMAVAVAARLEMPLVLVGGPGDESLAAVGERCRQRGVDCVVTGFVSDAHLAAIYRGAAVLLHPSLSEGFGFPPLEAMACGVPVAVSARGALEEVTGGAAVVCPADDIGAWVDGVARLCRDPEERARRIDLGLRRAAAFREPETAARLCAIYRATLAGKPR